MSNKQGKIRKKCPLCGGNIIVSELFQLSQNHKLTKSGKLSKRYTQTDAMPEDISLASCSSNCGASWEVDDFTITPEGYFLDLKYVKL